MMLTLLALRILISNQLTLHTKEYLLTLGEAITIYKRQTIAQHKKNADTSVTFQSLSSLAEKKCSTDFE